MIALLALLSCAQIEAMMGTKPEPKADATKAEPVKVEAPKVTVTPLLSGKYAEALPDLEAALAKAPTDDGAWANVELAAVRGNQAGALLDRLAADQAIGGRVDKHQALRAELALIAGRPADAFLAARLLEPVAPGDATALMVRAIQAGAPKPADPLSDAVSAWIKAVATAPLPAAAEGETPRLAWLRAETLAKRGDRAGALAAVNGVTATGLLGWRITQARLEWTDDAAAGWTETTAAVDAAVKSSDLLGAALLLDAGSRHAYAQWKPTAVADAAVAARKNAEEVGNLGAAGTFAAVQATALLHLGNPVDAAAAAEFAGAQADSASQGKWALALSRAMLGDAKAVQLAGAGLPEAEGVRIRDLANAMTGVEVALPSAGLTGDAAAWQALLGAGWLEAGPASAARAADVAQSPDLKLWGQLWASRAPVTGPQTPAMNTENAVRAWLADGTAGAVLDEAHPNAAGWRATLSRGQAKPSDPGAAALARLVASVDGGFAEQAGGEMNDASAILADWRSGPLAPVTSLDGPRAAELHRLVATPGRLTDDEAIKIRAPWHAWRQRELERAALWQAGVTPIPAGLGTPERLTALWAAVAKQRAAVLMWLGGAGAYPAGSASELDNAAVELRLLPRKVGTLADLRDMLGRSAALSFVPLADGSWEALYLTDHGHKRVPFPKTVADDVASYLAAIRSGRNNLALGNRVRAQLIDPATEVLTGYGNYFVMGPDPLGALPIGGLPEQSEGLRYLAAIRHTFYVGSFTGMTPPTFAENDFSMTMLAVVGDSESGEVVKRIFPDAVVLAGKDATRDAWLKDAPRARFLHIANLQPSPAGGFIMPAGGTLDPGDIASTPLVARTVVVVGTSSSGEALARLGAFRAAGAGDYFTTGVGANKAFNLRMAERFWDSTNKRLPVWKAVSEPRMQVAKDLDERGDVQPAIWGGILSHGRLQ